MLFRGSFLPRFLCMRTVVLYRRSTTVLLLCSRRFHFNWSFNVFDTSVFMVFSFFHVFVLRKCVSLIIFLQRVSELTHLYVQF